jgi:hypothetical protein
MPPRHLARIPSTEHESRPSAATRRAAVARRTLALATPLFRARTRSRALAAQLAVIATEYTSPEQQTQQQEEDDEARRDREGGVRSSKTAAAAAGGAASASPSSAASFSMPSADAMRHFARWREAREKQEDEA